MNAKDKCGKEKNKGPKLEINSDGGLWGWLPETVAAFQLGLKDRKDFMISDCGVERGSLPQVEGTAEQRFEVGKAQDMCGSVKII